MTNSVIENDLDRIINFDLPWIELADKTILISGANGMLPAYMVEVLLRLNKKRNLNIKIIALVRNKDKALVRFSQYQERPELKLLIQDVCEPIVLKEKIHYIIHAASQASPKFYGKDPIGTLLPNILGTYNLLKLARENGAAGFLFFSSSEVYGRIKSLDRPINENTYGYIDPTDVRSCYAESKKMGEVMCVSWFHQYRVKAKVVRPFHVYGPGMNFDDGRVFTDFCADIFNNQNIVVKSDGRAMRAFCYLADAVAGFFTVLFKGEEGGAYNVGNPDGAVSILSLANKLVSLFPEKGLKVVKKEAIAPPGYIKSDVLRMVPDIYKIRQLGWNPTTSIEEGFLRTIRSFS